MIQVERKGDKVDASCTRFKTRNRREEYSVRGAVFISLFRKSRLILSLRKLVARKVRKFRR